MRRKRTRLHLTVLIITIAAAVWIGGNLFALTNTDKPPTAPSGTSQEIDSKSGETVFMQNCARCHKPPMVISPRMTGTVVMHMRVRAKLSKQDEQALLRYLAP
jgi:cytochrome c5